MKKLEEKNVSFECKRILNVWMSFNIRARLLAYVWTYKVNGFATFLLLFGNENYAKYDDAQKHGNFYLILNILGWLVICDILLKYWLRERITIVTYAIKWDDIWNNWKWMSYSGPEMDSVKIFFSSYKTSTHTHTRT